ncbi:MAG TPA: wax ester/triacylglycerol synthase domain-containing protein [Solirubrobacteraceae bacterium]|jgi:diacylglycerol O-acyltransferase|nr:wax ester/triacylglycerol synthase domain-containing protein [Solirubrobacteraceae bacterium]
MSQVFSFPRKVNDVDAVHFFLGRLQRCNVAMTMVAVLGGEVQFGEVRELLRPLGDEVPRWKDYLRRAPWDLTAPTWAPRVNMTIDEHLTERHLAPGATWSNVWDVVDELQNLPFPEEKPPWQVILLQGAPGGRSIVVSKVHHSFSDGTALALMFGKMFMRAALEASGVEMEVITAPAPQGRAREAWLTWRSALGDWSRYVIRAAGPYLRDRHERAREADGMRAYLQRTRWSWTQQSATRRSASFRVPMDVWRAEAARRHGGINDLYLALMAHIMREYTGAGEPEAQALRVVMPVSTRPTDGLQDGGNMVSVGILELSGTAGDLDDLGEVKLEAALAKEAARAYKPTFVDISLPLLPGALRARLAHRRFAANDVLATSMVLPDGEMCGVPFEMVFMTAPVIGIPLSFSLATYRNQLFLAANYDVGIVTNPRRLERCISTCLVAVFGSDAVTVMRDAHSNFDKVGA